VTPRHVQDLYLRLVSGREITAAENQHIRTCTECTATASRAARFDEELRSLSRGMVSGGPLPEAMFEDRDRQPSRWRIVPSLAAGLLVVGLAIFSLSVVSILRPTGSSSPPAVSSSASGSPPTTPSMQESQTAAPPQLVGNLVTGPAGCGEGSIGYSIWVPAGWYANAAHDGRPACRQLDPDPQLVSGDPAQLGAAIQIAFNRGDPGLGPVVTASDMTLSGLPARRLVEQTPAGLRVVYLVGMEGTLPASGSQDLVLIAATRAGQDIGRVGAALDDVMGRFAVLKPLQVSGSAMTEAKRLFASTSSCADAQDGYRVEFPAAWFTNPAGSGASTCHWFGPKPLKASGPSAEPVGAVIGLFTFDGAVSTLSGTIGYESVSIAGHVAIREEIAGGTFAAPDLTSPTYRYIVQLGASPIGLNLVASTRAGSGVDYQVARALLDLVMGSMTLSGH
jgi:hypothetical protein